MKKAIAILVLLIFWSNTSSADLYTHLKPLPKKSGAETAIYNGWIKDYNEFKQNFRTEVFRYCFDQMIKGAGFNQLITETKCEYNALVELAKSHNVYIPKFESIMHSWHGNLFAMSKAAAISLIKRYDDQVLKDHTRKQIELERRLFKKLDRAIQQTASKHNAEYYAKKKKKKKEEGPKIDDNKIIAAASGTGFFVSNTGHIVTNHHVIDECKAVKVNYKGNEIEAKVLAIDKTNDLAILEANINPSKVFAVSNKDVALLEDVIVAGFPLGKRVSAAIKTHKGSVTALAGFGDNYSNFQTDATINQGNSGGPVMDHKGNIVGVAVALMSAEAGQNIFFAVKSSTLKTFANSNGISFLPPSNREMSNPELGKLITEGTLFLECWMTVAKIKQMIAQEENRKAFYSEFK